MRLHTASEVISLARKLENESAGFYKGLSGKYGKDEAALLSFTGENIKNVSQVERAYYGSISDAIEGGFAFDIEADNYAFEASLADNASYPEAVNKAIEIEKLIAGFYSDAAGQSQSLMADVQRVFKLLARKRAERIEKLGLLLRSAQADSG